MCHRTCALKGRFFTASKKDSRNFLCFNLKKPIQKFCYSYNLLISNRTSCHPIRSLIILVPIKQKGLLLLGCPILLITCMITDQIGLHSVLLPLVMTVAS